MRTPILLAAAALVVAGGTLDADDYLTKDGKLTQPLTVLQLQGGFAGFTGVEYKIATDGVWSSANVFNQKKTPMKKGKLNADQLAKLAGILGKYDLEKLPKKSGKQPGANPHTITFTYGNQKASRVGQEPPRLDKNNPAGSVDSRFAGIFQGVTGMLKGKK